MGNSLRCCLACVLPCGALDLIRIVHLSGYVEAMTGPITAGEFLQSYPNYVLSKPSSQGVVRKILILSPDSELKRGGIYFLIPLSSLPSDRLHHSKKVIKTTQTQNKIAHDGDLNLGLDLTKLEDENGGVCHTESKPKSKSKYGRHHRRRSSRGKSGVWQPQLESITEDL